MESLVSILMPMFNSDKWLADTLRSVQDQTHSNWELIIIDDGSEDNSFEIANEFSNNDNRIKVYQQPNKGACAARNKAFELSSGDYIQYLDADDLLVPNKIEKQLSTILNVNENNAIANCGWEKFHKQPSDAINNKQRIDKSYKSPVEWLLDSWILGEHGQTNCWLTPRNIIEKVGGWDESLTVNQDGEFFCRVLLEASHIYFVDEVKVYYRIGNQSSVSQRPSSIRKASSLLKSYYLYQLHLSKFINIERVQTAIMANYLKFIYQHNTKKYDSLVQEALEYCNKLNLADKVSLIKSNFHPSAGILGFKLFLIVRRVFKSISF